MRQDRRAEQGVVGFTGRLQGADEGRVGVVGLAQVEELDAPGQQQGLGQGGGDDGVAYAFGFAEQVGAEAGVLDHRRVQVGGQHAGVHAAVRNGDRRVVTGDDRWLDDAPGLGQRQRGPGVVPGHRGLCCGCGVGTSHGHVPGRGEAEFFDGELEHVDQEPLMVGSRPWGSGGLPAPDLAVADLQVPEPELRRGAGKGVSKCLLRCVPGVLAGGLEPDVADGLSQRGPPRVSRSDAVPQDSTRTNLPLSDRMRPRGDLVTSYISPI